MKTYIPTDKDINAKVYLVDATSKTLGRLATRVATLLMGKDKAIYSRDKLVGDQVVIINAEKIFVTGRKREQKLYSHYTGYPSGLKQYNLETLAKKKPDQVILLAVKRMLPKNRLGREMLRRLRVYAGPEHRQQAQKPELLEV